MAAGGIGLYEKALQICWLHPKCGHRRLMLEMGTPTHTYCGLSVGPALQVSCFRELDFRTCHSKEGGSQSGPAEAWARWSKLILHCITLYYVVLCDDILCYIRLYYAILH